MLDFVALKAELVADPTARGYSAALAAGDFSPVAALLNEVQGGITVDVPTVEGRAILEALEWSDLSALPVNAMLYLSALCQMDAVPTDSANVRAVLATILAGTGSLANLVALQTRSGSRAEQLFGAGVIVSAADVLRAWREF